MQVMERTRTRLSEVSVASWITLGVVGAAVVFTLMQLQPGLLFKNTTPAGGDTGAHVWGPDYLKNHLLTKGRITGWAPSWYAGFPAYTFYFPLPALLIAFLSFVLPYGMAFKIITVSGILTLPIAAWAFGRLSGMRFPGPAMLAVAAVPFLFYSGFSSGGGSWSYTIYGGNIASTLAGEFSFSVSLSFALVFLGMLARSLDTGRYRALTAILLACSGLSHVLPTIFAVCGALVLLALRPNVARAKLTATVLAIGAMLAAFWSLPFLLRLPYTNNMGWEKLTTYQENLIPGNIRWVILLAAVGAVLSVFSGRRTGLFFTIMAVLAAVVFVVAPAGRLWNARVLPFWYLSVFLLCGVALAELADLVARAIAADPARPPPQVKLAAPIVVAVAAWMFVGAPLGVLPKFVPHPPSPESGFIPSWAKWNFSGFEGKTAYPEYKAIVDTMSEVGRTNGCGRAHWEYDSSLDGFGTPMALMLLPYWTDGCIDSMEGLYFESSASVPYHFLSAAELAKAPSNPMRSLPYNTLDVDAGVRDLQLLGSRYYLAFSPEAVSQAAANPALREVASTGPWSSRGGAPVTWHVYEVAGAELVTPLPFKPAVLTGVDGREWTDIAVSWFDDPALREVPLAAGGPDDWPRVAVRSQEGVKNGKETVVGSDVAFDPVAPEPVPPAQVRNITEDDDGLSFDVDRTGSPVLVKVSYFPNWKASGAEGPWRVTPNLMVVVPTSNHVELHYGYTPVDIAGWVLTLTGVGLAILVRRRGPVDVDGDSGGGGPDPGSPPAPPPPPLDDRVETVPDRGPPEPVRSGRRARLTTQGRSASVRVKPMKGPLGPGTGP